MDYDIDAVSLATFDIDNNGILLLWSPYADISTEEKLAASLELPFPSGEKLEIPESSDNTYTINLLNKYKNILSINEEMTYNKDTKEYNVNPSKISLNLTLNTPDDIRLFKEFLSDIWSITKPSSVLLLQQFAYMLMRTGVVSFKFRNPELVIDIFNKLENIVNEHNLYFDNISKYKLDKIINNYSIYSMYTTINDPANLIQAQTSVDGTTGPLKEVANESSESKEAKFRTPGNVFNKFLSIVENLVGKLGIGICATGLKAFFGLTLYNNYLLNYGTTELQLKLLFGNDHKGHIISDKLYKTLANIRSQDPNTITNELVLEALSYVTNDNDAALLLSALLSLATD